MPALCPLAGRPHPLALNPVKMNVAASSLRLRSGQASSRFCLSGSFLPYRPPRSNFNHSFFSRDIVTITAPGPVFRSLDEPSCDRITVDVFQLLCAFGATPDIEIVIPWLPEVFATSDEAPRDGLFQGFQRSSEYCALRFGH